MIDVNCCLNKNTLRIGFVSIGRFKLHVWILVFGYFHETFLRNEGNRANEIVATNQTSQRDVFISEMWRFLPNEGYRFNRIVVPNETPQGDIFLQNVALRTSSHRDVWSVKIRFKFNQFVP